MSRCCPLPLMGAPVWWCFAGELCSWTDEDPQAIHGSPRPLVLGQLYELPDVWYSHPAGEQSCESGPHHPGAPQSHLFAARTKECRIFYIKGGGGGTEVSSHNILSRGICQETKQALWKQFSFLHCWIGLNLLCSYCLSLDLRIIGYGTMKFCPNELCSADLQEEVHLYLLS